jgi:X-Pro dipeptidyl-peptidase
MYFHQGGHGGAPPHEMMNRWFTRFLYGVDNGVERGPKAWIVRETPPAPPPAPGEAPPAGGRGRGRGATPQPTAYADYPNPDARMVTFHLSKGGAAAGGLSVAAMPGQGRESFTDNVALGAPALALAAESPHRLMYATPALAAPLHISGTPRVTIRLASSKPAATLWFYLVKLPWGEGGISTSNLITRGWADPQNHASLTRGGNYDARTPGAPLVPGQFYTLTFDLQPDDQIVPAGMRIGLMLLSSDRDFTLWPQPGTELTVDLDATRIQIPIVGGETALGGGR